MILTVQVLIVICTKITVKQSLIMKSLVLRLPTTVLIQYVQKENHTNEMRTDMIIPPRNTVKLGDIFHSQVFAESSKSL